MILPVKNEISRIAQLLGANFVDKSISELQHFAQNNNFLNPLVNLQPINSGKMNVMPSGAIRYDFQFKIDFLQKFQKDNNLENTKDYIIQDMIWLCEDFFKELNRNTLLIFINPSWTWSVDIVRQHTSNLLCGCTANIFLDTACNRLNRGISFDYLIDVPLG